MASEEITSLLSLKVEAAPETSQQLQPVTNDENLNHTHQETDGFFDKMIVDQRDQLLQISFRKDSTIECLKLELQLLETQLKSAVKEKSEALARLDSIEGKELNVSFKEKQMEMDGERVDNQIANLTDDLNKNVAELIAVRNDYLWATTQLQIDSKKYTEQLEHANSSICKLTQANEMLKSENEEYASKLSEQIDESSQLMIACDEDLRSKVELVELHKANSDDHKAYINELEAAVIQLKELVNETADECDSMATKLNTCDKKYQKELDVRDEIIASLKQELRHANDLLSSDENENDSDNQMATTSDNDSLHHIVFPTLDDTRFEKGATMTEMYTKYCKVAQELHAKQQDYNELEMETKNVVEGVKESARKFNALQLDNKKLKAANEKFNEEKKNLIVEKVVTRAKLESTLVRCNFLENEKKRLEVYASKYLEYLLSKSPGESVKPDVNDSQRDLPQRLTELEEQNQGLLQLVRELRDANENFLSKSCKENSSLRNDVCHKSVEVNENELNYYSADPSRFKQKKNVLQIEEKLQNKIKELDELKQEYNTLKNEQRELTAEKVKLSTEVNLSNIKSTGLNHQIQIVEEQNKMYVNTISEQKIAMTYLTNENKSCIQKLCTLESRCDNLQSECRKLTDTKNSLEIEVETLKRELRHQMKSNHILETKLQITGESSKRLQTDAQLKQEERNAEMRIQTQKLQNELDQCRTIITDMTSKSMMDMSTQMDDTENQQIENSEPITFEIRTMDDVSRKSKFFNSLQLAKAENQERADSSTSSQVVTRKRSRSDKNDADYHVTLRSQKKPRVSFTTDTKSYDGVVHQSRKKPLQSDTKSANAARSSLPISLQVIKMEHEELDDNVDINVCDDNDQGWIPAYQVQNPNIELELRKEVRTRRQTQFLRDAFLSGTGESEVRQLIGIRGTIKTVNIFSINFVNILEF